MFLKRLDITGFKSFAQKVSIDFVPGVTAVVGPNGSGKSNITDAIRWVMGEQSAKSLRGGKMEDVIFAGSESRRAVNVADVTITLENDDQFLPLDYHEVSITRRVNRSGDSEFLINNQPCRLKDIVDLFMDSGLGREAFSIISQGKVEEVLSSKPDERRKIFEEAAGVLKYKTRKRKAELRLIETQENLNRVLDILHEIEGQLEPLKIQSSIAKDYLQKKEELEQIDIEVTVFEIEELHGKWEVLKRDIASHQQMEQSLSANVGEREQEINRLRAYIQRADEEIDALHKHLLFVSEEVEKLEGKKEVLKERKKNASQNKEQLERLVKEYTQTKEELVIAKQKEENELTNFENDVAKTREEVAEQERLFATYSENLDEQLEQLKSEYFELANAQTASRNEIAFLEQQKHQTSEKEARLLKANEQYVQQRADLERKKGALIDKLQNFQKELQDSMRQLKEQLAKLDSLREEYRKQESTLYQAYQYVQQTKSRKQMLEEMQEDYEGYFHGVKEILKARSQKLYGIEGAIAELVSVPKEYETAIEIALGGATQHIVTSDEQSARQAISFLKQNHYGRATFLPLTSVRSRFIPPQTISLIESHDTFVGVASSLVKYDEKYRSIAENLLGTVIIVKDLKGANELARLIQHRYRFVTLTGDVVNPGGSMTGGSVKQKTNSLLGRQRELETITAKLKEMEEKTLQLEKNVKAKREMIEELEQAIGKEQSFVKRLEEQEKALDRDVKQVEIEEQAVNDRLAMYDQDMVSFKSDQEHLVKRIQVLEKQLDEAKEQTLELEVVIEELTHRKRTQQTSREEVRQKLTEVKVELAGQEQSLKNKREKYERICFELNQTTKRLEEVTEDLALLANEMTSNDSGELSLEEAAAEKVKEKAETLKKMDDCRAERLKSQNKLEDAERFVKELHRQHKQITNALKDEEVKLNRIDVELDSRLHQLNEEYQTSFEAAKASYQLTVPIDEARKKIKLIKLGIEELGTVNIGSIEQYERTAERYEFLSSQKNDLDEAKNTLYQVIEEMDEEMKKRFSDTFYQIREEFNHVFQSLFGGGKAELKLTDATDLLNTGVDIIAQPPGKKLQNLGLLSGGERSLTAIALLFSILKVRPVPFCVLDEVEAALDEANVHRFATYLRSYSEQTQFIVITHRKGTMEEADVLYGVTMQESGVSKLVSVRLEDSKQYA
ncbi:MULTISPECIES: chromosome segregation protein SMC [Bacillaceae]|uniref:chromosome segregation protein SMC n=1 Tax=Bacillaceae TaxID=186817 RepID=UPI0010470BCD|nr:MULTISPECIES: chromosome segregation protein SMC [Bacillaceae]MDT2045764.1 chromosome segregation protein SMC [Priestia flexa]TDB50502.1 chromosome segregation protein SMC [Bacillus sp. CBEL-1]USY54197.1 chromosome segregation protein SMC [Bacillus sp. 1780r2a1]